MIIRSAAAGLECPHHWTGTPFDPPRRVGKVSPLIFREGVPIDFPGQGRCPGGDSAPPLQGTVE